MNKKLSRCIQNLYPNHTFGQLVKNININLIKIEKSKGKC